MASSPFSIPVAEASYFPLEAPKQAPRDETAYNCYMLVKSRIPEFPLTKDLVPNSIYPVKGGVVLLDYNGTPHYALTPDEVEVEGYWIDESNFESGKYTRRFITWEYARSHGAKYWRPEIPG